MSTIHTVAVHFRYDRYMRRLVNEFLGRNPIETVLCVCFAGHKPRGLSPGSSAPLELASRRNASPMALLKFACFVFSG